MYVGPEMLMPVASVLAAVTGFLLLFWRRTVAVLRGGFRFIGRLFSRRAD